MKEAFPGVAKIAYEGPKSKNPLSFKHYNATKWLMARPCASICGSR
jgi:xylose isomerase